VWQDRDLGKRAREGREEGKASPTTGWERGGPSLRSRCVTSNAGTETCRERERKSKEKDEAS
jgi:hypothetical protein